jgi:hypothetical protein
MLSSENAENLSRCNFARKRAPGSASREEGPRGVRFLMSELPLWGLTRERGRKRVTGGGDGGGAGLEGGWCTLLLLLQGTGGRAWQTLHTALAVRYSLCVESNVLHSSRSTLLS